MVRAARAAGGRHATRKDVVARGRQQACKKRNAGGRGRRTAPEMYRLFVRGSPPV